MELSSWVAARRSATEEIPQYVMEPEGLLPCSQELFTSPCSDPDQSSPYNLILFFYVLFQ
jgi:hypothetical protein